MEGRGKLRGSVRAIVVVSPSVFAAIIVLLSVSAVLAWPTISNFDMSWKDSARTSHAETFGTSASADEIVELVWVRQFGTAVSFGMAVDASGVYVSGCADGALPGQTGSGFCDAFVRKYDHDGNELWTRQFGSSTDDTARGVAMDSSGVYVAGSTLGVLPGQTSTGGTDAFVRKYDHDGNELWTRQFGSSSSDQAEGIAVDASGAYLSGSTDGTLPGQTNAGATDVFVRKFDQDGNELWTRQFGTEANDYAGKVTVDSSGSYVAGWTGGVLPGQTSAGLDDGFLRKYDGDGREIWTRQFGGSSSDTAFGIAADFSGVYVSGVTHGTLPGQTSAGGADGFVCKYDLDGNEVWTRQFGTSSDDEGAIGIAVDGAGVDVVGRTGGAFPGQTNAGSADVFVREYDPEGNDVWTRQFGSSSRDEGRGVSVDASGVYVSGFADGALPGQTSSGSRDAFVARLSPVSEPQPQAPSAPQGLLASPGDAQVTLTWQAPSSDGGSPITNYKIYRGASPGGEALLTTVGNVVTYVDSGLTNGLTYYYQVSAVNDIGEGPRSSEVPATPTAGADMTNPTIAITAPASGATLTSTIVTVSGTASDNIAIQKVELSKDGTTWVLATGTTSWSGSLTLAEGTQTIYARATDTSGNTATVSIPVTVQLSEVGAEAFPLALLGGGVVAVAVAVAAALVLLRRKGGGRAQR